MKHWPFLTAIALVLASCGARPVIAPSEAASEPAVRARLSGAERLAQLEAQLLAADSTAVRTVAKVQYIPKNGKPLSLRADIRTYSDSLFWVDLSDPVLGIKVARALITKDTALAYSRLQNIWLGESPDRLIDFAGLPITFELLLDLWHGRPALNGYTCGCALGPVYYDDTGLGPVWKFDWTGGRVEYAGLPNDQWGLNYQSIETTSDTYKATYRPGQSLLVEWSGGQVNFDYLEQYRTGVTFPFQIPEGLERYRL